MPAYSSSFVTHDGCDFGGVIKALDQSSGVYESWSGMTSPGLVGWGFLYCAYATSALLAMPLAAPGMRIVILVNCNMCPGQLSMPRLASLVGMSSVKAIWTGTTSHAESTSFDCVMKILCAVELVGSVFQIHECRIRCRFAC